MEWNDLQYVLAVAEEDGLLGGARALGVHSTTVSRRIKQIERQLRVPLFEKYRHGVVLTDAGRDVVDVARTVQGLTHDLSARLDGRDEELAGTIRVTSVDSLLRHWMPDLAEFQRRYPAIQLELSAGLAMANLTQREADVAIRIAGAAPEHLIGARLCSVEHAIYVADSLYERFGPDAPLGSYPWIAYDLAVFRGIDGYLAAHVPEAVVAARVERIDLMMSAIEGGLGVGILQCVIGDPNPALRRLEPPAPPGTSSLWVLTHPQLRGAARVSALMAWLRDLVRRDRDLLEGRAAQA